MTPAPENEHGIIAAVELRRQARRGSMQPLLCRANDGANYIVKPYSRGSTWPLVLEWVCARLGRSAGLPIPNYRQIIISDELAEAWNAVNERCIDPGIGFGSQQVPNVIEFETSLSASLTAELRLRVLAFDWWVRNRDRGEKNPNLLWSAETRSLHVIDHDQAGMQEDASLFWGIHLFKSVAPTTLAWLPPPLARDFEQALTTLLPTPIDQELPPEWTIDPAALVFFVRQLK